MGRRFITPLCLTLFSLIFSLVAAFTVGERFFFDRLFYRKSNLHGYSRQMYNLSASPSSWIIEHRFKDTRNLIASGRFPNDVFNVAIIGDSLVYGLGVREGERITEILEKKLAKIRATKVYNLGQPGDSILDYYALYTLAQRSLFPNVTIIMIVDNDLIFDASNRYPGEEEVFGTLRNTCSGELFSNLRIQLDMDRSRDTEISQLYFPSFSQKFANICFLREIATATASDKRLFFYPYNIFSTAVVNPKTPEEQEAWIMDTYTKTIQASGGRVVLSSNIPGFIYTPISQNERHPSRQTHALWAESLYKEITENPVYGFAISKIQ